MKATEATETIEEVRSRVDDTMSNFYSIEGMTLDKALDILRPRLDDFIYLYETVNLPDEDDWRAGEETYGYQDEEHIIDNLFYISDRWNGAFRLRWMIDMLDPDYYAYKGKEQ